MHTSVALLLELGLILTALSVLGALARRFALTPVPLYLLTGLALGEGGIAPVRAAGEFVQIAGAIGVVLLLLTLGLEFSVSWRSAAPGGRPDSASPSPSPPSPPPNAWAHSSADCCPTPNPSNCCCARGERHWSWPDWPNSSAPQPRSGRSRRAPLTGSLATRARAVLSPLRDLFAAFFLAIALAVELGALPPVLPAALALTAVTAATKLLTGAYAASRDKVGRRGQLRARAALIPRGKSPIVILGLAADPTLGTLVTAYVFILPTTGPLIARLTGPAPALST